MDYNKRRWLERIQQQQEEEEPRDVYPIEHRTYFSKKYEYYYIAIVEVYDEYTVIEIFKAIIKKKEIDAPFWVKFLLKILEDKPENNKKPNIPAQIITHNDIVPRVIRKMVVEYEIPLYQRYMAEQEQKEIEIDYAEELRERLERRPQITNLNREHQATSYEAAPVHIWDEGPELTEEEKKERRVQELAERDGVDPAKYRNLLPFRDKKSG